MDVEVPVGGCVVGGTERGDVNTLQGGEMVEVIESGFVRMCVKCGCRNARACGWKGAWCAVTAALLDVTTSQIKKQAQRAT